MPLTPTGKRVLKKMQQEYGYNKGKSVFYASINANRLKHMERKERQHKKESY